MLTTQDILSVLPDDAEKIYIAYSGGKDSHVLLHLLGSIPHLKSRLKAVYIHHGLQLEADSWEKHCKLIAFKNDIDFQCIRVNIQKIRRQSLEELARDARYQVFKSLMHKGDVLLLAQHREDQLETVLLQLFRGAGVQGLAGMPVSMALGEGHMIRPLLDISQISINEYADQHHLQWIEDPSNASDDFDRNYLRNQIVPQLKQRWSAIDKTVSRSARHCANSFVLNKNLSQQLLKSLHHPIDNSLDIQQLSKLDSIKQSLVIRQWFDLMCLRMPSEKMINRIVNEVVNAKSSANPEVKNKLYSIRRYRNKMFCFKPGDIDFKEIDQYWEKRFKPLRLKGGVITMIPTADGIAESRLKGKNVWVKFRQGAEMIRLPRRQGRHSLKKLFQEQGIPPWERSNIPLIYVDNKLAAIVGIGVSVEFFSSGSEPCFSFQWCKAD